MDKLNMGKLSSVMTGKERAILILRDYHKGKLGINNNFLSEADKITLMSTADENMKEDMRKMVNLYGNFLFAMITLNSAFYQFEASFFRLGFTRMYLSISTTLAIAIGFIEAKKKAEPQNMREWNLLQDAIDHLQVLRKIECGTEGKTLIVREDIKHFMQEWIPVIHDHACFIVTMKAVIDKMISELGFDPLEGQNRLTHPSYYEKAVFNCLYAHYKVVYDAINDNLMSMFRHETQDDMRALMDVLYTLVDKVTIEEPEIQENVLKEWEKRMFEY